MLMKHYCVLLAVCDETAGGGILGGMQLRAPVLGLEGNLTRTPGLGLPAPAPQEGRSLKPEQQTPTQGWQVDRARALACT